MQLSKRESKYRKRIIAEFYFNKNQQKELHDLITIDGMTYYEFYTNMNKVSSYTKQLLICQQLMLARMSLSAFERNMNKLNLRIKNSSKETLNEILYQLSEEWNNKKE